MKRTITLLAAAVMLAACAAPGLAQTKECNDENKGAWYDTFLKNRQGEAPQQKVAYDAAKQYLTSCPDNPEDAVAQYLKKWVTAYEKASGEQTTRIQFDDAVAKKNYAEQIRLGKQILATDPDNPAINVIMGIAGLGDSTLLNESAQYARKAIQLIEAGKPSAPYSKDQALAYLNWTVGKANLSSAPAQAIPNLLKAAKLESEVKKNPQLYIDLATAYENGPRAKLSDEYPTKLGPNKTETPESKLVLENLNQIIDRQIDAEARAAALTTNAANKKNLMDALTELYKYRNKTDTGLNELVASVLSKPIPDVPTPITQLPTPTPTPATGGSAPGAAGGTRSTGNSTSTAGQNKTGSSSGTGTQPGNTPGSAKPTPTPTPKPKPRRSNHRQT